MVALRRRRRRRRERKEGHLDLFSQWVEGRRKRSRGVDLMSGIREREAGQENDWTAYSGKQRPVKTNQRHLFTSILWSSFIVQRCLYMTVYVSALFCTIFSFFLSLILFFIYSSVNWLIFPLSSSSSSSFVSDVPSLCSFVHLIFGWISSLFHLRAHNTINLSMCVHVLSSLTKENRNLL